MDSLPERRDMHAGARAEREIVDQLIIGVPRALPFRNFPMPSHIVVAGVVHALA
jgi:hypothetical protein